MTYTWTTLRGTNIEMDITTTHRTTETINLDGHKHEVKCSKWNREITRLTANGKDTDSKRLITYAGQDAVLIGQSGKDNVYVVLPADIADEIYGAERAERREKMDKELAAEKRYNDHRRMVERAMAE